MKREALELRGRILGVLLRDARMHADRTQEECATFLGISLDTFAAYEEGEQPISLPELEVLAYFLNVPVSHFLRDDPQLLGESLRTKIPEILALRHRIVGLLLRQAREEAGRSPEELAHLLGCSPERIREYEYGERPIPLPELEALARALNRPLEHFLDQVGPIGRRVQQEKQATEQAVKEVKEKEPADKTFQAFQQLPPHIRDFVLKPINRSYIEIAMKLADLPAGRLREIAEGLLEITY
ncbi:MAG: helix-turn-helix domain-containing protein [Anaerolineae bacterium]|nr:helix-turn-helix domain-containing protein [Anaerolineae bacterium]MDW7991929.1 helix-turn-helix domain-containing protein [Anaerolineae bacterium]